MSTKKDIFVAVAAALGLGALFTADHWKKVYQKHKQKQQEKRSAQARQEMEAARQRALSVVPAEERRALLARLKGFVDSVRRTLPSDLKPCIKSAVSADMDDFLEGQAASKTLLWCDLAVFGQTHGFNAKEVDDMGSEVFKPYWEAVDLMVQGLRKKCEEAGLPISIDIDAGDWNETTVEAKIVAKS